MFVAIIFIIVGLAILIAGAEGLVRGASSLANRFHISPLVIGLTVVSFGTSAPELTVNLVSAFQGSSDLAIGNIIGSNIANILLILGISAIIVPLRIKSNTLWKELPFALFGGVIIYVMAQDRFFDSTTTNVLSHIDGAILISFMVIFMIYIFKLARRDKKETKRQSAENTPLQYSAVVSTALTVAGLVGLIVGGRMLVSGAISIAEAAGLSEALIGLTIVAIGTSLPELATSVVAALKKQTDIIIGNVVGSNIFNIFFVLGTTSTILPLTVSNVVQFDIVISIATTILLLVFILVNRKKVLTRVGGSILLGLYIFYTFFLVLRG